MSVEVLFSSFILICCSHCDLEAAEAVTSSKGACDLGSDGTSLVCMSRGETEGRMTGGSDIVKDTNDPGGPKILDVTSSGIRS